MDARLTTALWVSLIVVCLILCLLCFLWVTSRIHRAPYKHAAPVQIGGQPGLPPLHDSLWDSFWFRVYCLTRPINRRLLPWPNFYRRHRRGFGDLFDCIEQHFFVPDFDKDGPKEVVSPYEVENGPNPVIHRPFLRSIKSALGFVSDAGNDTLREGSAISLINPASDEIPCRFYEISSASQSPPIETEQARAIAADDSSAGEAAASLELHRNPSPSRSGRFSCEHCRVSFETNGRSRKHLYRKHIKRYKCDICDVAFNMNADLNRHKLSVHGETSRDMDDGCRCGNEWCTMQGKVSTKG